MWNKLWLSLLLFVLSGSDTSCLEPQTNELVGKWAEIGSDGRSEYFKDGTAIFMDDGLSISGKYEFLEDGRVKMEAAFLGIPWAEVYEVSFSGDVVTFTDSKGKIEKYRRLK